MSSTIRTKNYQVYLGNDMFYQMGKFFSRNKRPFNQKIFILVDENTRRHCLPLAQENVFTLQDAEVLELKPGENSKRIEVIAGLWHELTSRSADRNSILVNLGGGVVGDVGGFTAATYMRGIDFINLPTTLLAMVDASIGGKNGINFDGFKNHVGTFEEPRAVFISPVFLKTLPERELRSGFAEVIKHALISSRQKWEDVLTIDHLESAHWFELIRESVWTKNKIVHSDFRDRGLRKALNFGHTIGHALESFSLRNHSDPLKHGEAVAIGIIGETYLSSCLCGLPEQDARRIYRFIRGHFPVTPEFKPSELIDIMKADKKNVPDKINFSLIKSVGEPAINQFPDETRIREALEFCKEQLVESG